MELDRAAVRPDRDVRAGWNDNLELARPALHERRAVALLAHLTAVHFECRALDRFEAHVAAAGLDADAHDVVGHARKPNAAVRTARV